MGKVTEELLNNIKNCDDIKDVIEENEASFLTESLKELFNKHIAEKNLKIADIERRSGQGEYVYKVINGTRRASRDILIAIAYGMGLRLDEAQFLLRTAEAAQLNPRNKRDSVFIYGLVNKKDVYEIQEILEELGERGF